jgi:RND family efflux transporter MFP subunit
MTGNYKLNTNPRTGKLYKLGDAVKKGQVIIVFENKEYENSTALDSRKLSLEIAEQEQVKQKELFEKGGVTLSEMRNTDVKVTNARYDLDNANISLDKMKVVAPFDGVIVSLPHYTVDSRINQGSPMVGIMDYARLYMDINLPESAIEYVKTNQPVRITHYTLPEDTLDAIISELSPAISTETRTFKGKVTIDNKDLKIRPGMFVKADIVVDKAESAIIIPKDAIISNRNRKYVYIVERNTAVMRVIKTGLEDEENIQIIDGLNENENLVIRGHETLRENSRVKILK